MVVKRTYHTETSQAPDRRALGRVRVTIDDLQVLMELLTERVRPQLHTQLLAAAMLLHLTL